MDIGTYEAPEPAVPTCKNKPNAGFVSNSTRSFDQYVKQKLHAAKFGKTPLSSQSEVGGRRLSAAETDIESEDDEYLKVDILDISKAYNIRKQLQDQAITIMSQCYRHSVLKTQNILVQEGSKELGSSQSLMGLVEHRGLRTNIPLLRRLDLEIMM